MNSTTGTTLLSALTIAATATTTLGPAAHASACAQWAFPTFGTQLEQSNGWNVFLHGTAPNSLTYTGEALTYDNSLGYYTKPTPGDTMAAINGNQIRINIAWADKSIGDYQGTVNDDGSAQGTTVDMTKPSSTATWKTVGIFTCAE